MKKLFHSRFWWWIPTFFMLVGLLFWVSFLQPATVGQADAAVRSQRVLSVHEGKLALLRGDKVEEIYDVYLSSLPEKDRALLKDGIPITDDAQLTALLEDYCE